jgi:ATP-dependent Clp protease protease subunit
MSEPTEHKESAEEQSPTEMSPVEHQKSITDTQEIEKVTVEEEKDNLPNQVVIVNNLPTSQAELLKSKQIYLVGDITEDKSEEIMAALLYVSELQTREEPEDPEDPESPMKKVYDPIEIIVSTYGGSVVDMFAMYDTIRYLREKHLVKVRALGKVMSAGVLLIAAGSPGYREIGKNCRVMIHNVSAGYHGTITNIQNEIKEVEWLQKKYISCLAEETGMKKSKIRKMLDSGLDVYLSAQKALKFGIVDKII